MPTYKTIRTSLGLAALAEAEATSTPIVQLLGGSRWLLRGWIAGVVLVLGGAL